ncbi:MAG: T9SS type A sorting domain-containing protein [Bacteroidota bacterium]
MKVRLTGFFALVCATVFVTIHAQVIASFEDLPTTQNCNSSICDYEDQDDPLTAHTLQDFNGIPVSSPGAAGVLGFIATFTPSRTGSSTTGLTDGDFFGYAESTTVISQFGEGPTDGTQAYMIEDTDGLVTLTFDKVDLSGGISALFSMDFHLESTSYEESDGQNDRFYVRIDITNCPAATTVTVLDTDGGGSGGGGGGDIDDLAIEDSWMALNENLNLYLGCEAQLVIEVDFNSASEELVIDNISFSSGTILPVEYLSFDAEADNEGVMLDWATASEQENDYFIVERSADGRSFEAIGRIDGQGDSELRNDYQFLDQSPFDGQNFYRLKQYDFDGSMSMSGLISVDFRRSVAVSDFTLAPVPTQDFLNVRLDQEIPEAFDLEILNVYGQLILRSPANAGQLEYKLPVASLPTGFYWVRIGESVRKFYKR